MPTTLGSFPLREIAMLQLAAQPGRRWTIRDDQPWCHVRPADYPYRIQGWKLHVSATWLAAPLVLDQAARVLVEHGCAFKFAATLPGVQELTSKDADRAQAGKFIAAYPRDDDHLRVLAPLLDQATAGLPGPAILSDRPYRAGSLVHYRYGAFAGVPTLNNEGSLEARLEAPDGSLVEDVRRPWFCPPGWVTPPYPGPPLRAADPPERARPVMLVGRFRVDRAILHSARGGVYRATDEQTGEEVVIKQARPHISGLSTHLGDARAGLRHEAAMLHELAGLAPREVLLFEYGGSLFLAVEALPGLPLGAWIRRLWEEPAPDLASESAAHAPIAPARQPDGDPAAEPPPVAEVLAVAAELADLLTEIHRRGLVFRDLSPNNVLILADGTLRLVDPEAATRPGQWGTNAYTPGFAAPELVSGPPVGPAPGPAADYYSLGAILCYLATGASPELPSDDAEQPARTMQERLALLLRYAGPGNPAAQRLAPAILGLTAEQPKQRWDTTRLRGFLAGLTPIDTAYPDDRADRGRLEPDRQQELAEDGLAQLAEAVTMTAGDRLVPTRDLGLTSDPCNVQHGAAGVLAVLVRGSRLFGDGRLRDAVARSARWIDRRRLAVPKVLPGLYFGRSGTAWALWDAARHLDDAGMAERALELAAALPICWPNPDVTHGTAGVGLASLHLWYETKDQVFLDRAQAAADHVLERATRPADGAIHWRVPPEFDSKLAGIAHYGFAHGVAGIGYFLLATAAAAGRADCRRAAELAGETLMRAAIRSNGTAYWPDGLTGPADSDLRYHWCSGASGIGTFLLRLWQVTRDDRHLRLAREAAATVRHGRWLSGIGACHGLAGNGEFLLDMAAVAAGPYHGWAEELAACGYVRHARRDGRLMIYDEAGDLPNLDYQTGFGGLVGFLLRLRHGGSRLWMVDAAGRAA